MKIGCAHCGKELNRPPSRIAANPRQFCDFACMGAFRARQVEVACEVCGSRFTVKASRATQNRAITCSPACLSQLRSRNIVNHHDSAERRVTTCDQCGKAITRKPSQIAKYPTNFCSRACHHLYKIGKGSPINGNWYPCETCGKAVWRTPATMEAHIFCSRVCAGRPGEPRPNHPGPGFYGPTHPRWKGGPTHYGPGFTRAVSLAIRERDGFACKVCGTPEDRPGGLVVHHIDLAKTNHHPDNLITLCRRCHNRVHSGTLTLPN